MKLGSTAFGVKAKYFNDFDTCIESITNQENMSILKKFKTKIFNIIVYLETNNKASLHIQERTLEKINNLMIIPLLLVSLIVLPLQNDGYIYEYLTSKNYLLSLPPIIAIFFSIILRNVLSFDIRRIFLPLSMLLQSCMLITDFKIATETAYVLTYPAITAIAISWFLVTLKQLLLVIVLAIISLFIGNAFTGYFTYINILYIEVIFFIFGPLAFLSRLSYNQTESDFILQQEKINQNNKLSQIGQLNAS